MMMTKINCSHKVKSVVKYALLFYLFAFICQCTE